MRLTERMIHDPMRCLGCGKGNVPDPDTREVGPFIDLEQEVGWNDHAYLCLDCAVKAGSLAGMVTEDEFKDLQRERRNLEIALHEEQASHEETNRRLKGTQRKLLKV